MRARVFEKATTIALSENALSRIEPDSILQGMRMQENVSEDPEPYTSHDELILAAVRSLNEEALSLSNDPEKILESEHGRRTPEVLEKAVDFLLNLERRSP
jgi:hypothetical protein